MIYYFEQIESTNEKAKEMAKNGAEHGTVVVARSQTGGKGRLGRTFFSPRGGLYMSIILRQNEFPHNLKEWATIHASVCVCKTIERVTGFLPGVKWVNDIYLNDKKICGILSESASDDWAVVGIGINVHQPVEDFPIELYEIAGALYKMQEDPPELEIFLSELIPLLLAPPSTETIISEYKARLYVLTRKIIVSGGEEQYIATATGLTNKGHLIIEKEDGERIELSSGEVFSIRGY